MATLPTPGGDNNSWGSELNTWLLVGHNNDGTLRAGDGWMQAGETLTYASATTFTVSGDQTLKYSKGTRIKLTQTTDKYFVVVNQSYSAGTTTVTITGGTDYTLANAAINSPYFSYVATPQGYPGWFNYTPTLGAATTPPTMGSGSSILGRFYVLGRTVTVSAGFTFGSSGVAAGTGVYRPSLPVAVASTAIGNTTGGAVFLYDSSTGTHQTGSSSPIAAQTYAEMYPSSSTGGRVGAAVPWTWAANDQINFTTTYEL